MDLIKGFDKLMQEAYGKGLADGGKPWNYNNGILFLGCDDQGRDQTLVLGIRAGNDEPGDKEIFELVQHVYWNEEYGWADFDGITVDIQIGHNFHGVDDEIQEYLGIGDIDLADEFQVGVDNFYWIKINWPDWAS